MRTITTKLFKFSELSREAKDRAKRDYEIDIGYDGRAEEAKASLEALADHFDGRLVVWNFYWDGSSPSNAEFEMPEMYGREIKRRLSQLGKYNRKTLKGVGDCKLTGVCHDEDAIDGFRIAFIRDKERDLNKLMQAAFETWMKSCQDDYEYLYTDEAFDETCEANDYEFYENGKFYVAKKKVK